MASYSSHTVAQLKEMLKARGLPVNGVKADLIARLEESDKIDAELDEPEATEAPVEEDTKPTEPETTAVEPEMKAAEPVSESAAAEPATEPVAEPEEAVAEPAPEPILTPEQLKDAAVKLIALKLARAERFKLENDIKQLNAVLKRVNKFGVVPGSALARELGYKTEDEKKKEQSGSNRSHGRHRHAGRFHPFARERASQ